MNRAKTLKLLSSKSGQQCSIVVATARKGDYVYGVAKSDVKANYYTKIYTEADPKLLVKANEGMVQGTPVTVIGSTIDPIEYVYGSLWGYTIGPWNMSLIAKRHGSTESKAFLREKEKYRWIPPEDRQMV